VPIKPWWETNPATTPRQELGMVSPELPSGILGPLVTPRCKQLNKLRLVDLC